MEGWGRWEGRGTVKKVGARMGKIEGQKVEITTAAPTQSGIGDAQERRIGGNREGDEAIPEHINTYQYAANRRVRDDSDMKAPRVRAWSTDSASCCVQNLNCSIVVFTDEVTAIHIQDKRTVLS